LPDVTCSPYCRASRALQAALTEYVADALLADVDELVVQMRSCPPDDNEGVSAALDLFLRWIDQRELLIARLELTMAATRNAELSRLLADHRDRLVELVDEIMQAAGKEHSADRAEALVASYDGVLIAALLKPVRERRAFLTRSLDLLGSGLSASV